MVLMSVQKQCCYFLGTAESVCYHAAKDLIFAFLELLMLCEKLSGSATTLKLQDENL